MGIVTVILTLFKVDLLFLLTFFFLGSIITTSGVYDCFPPAIPGSNGWYLPLFEFWFWLAGVFPVAFFISFVVIQKTYSDEIDKDRTKIYGILIIGTVFSFIPLENISLYLYRGLEYYSPEYSCYHTLWINNLFPAYYLIAIPGIILLICSFIWSAKHREVKN